MKDSTEYTQTETAMQEQQHFAVNHAQRGLGIGTDITAIRLPEEVQQSLHHLSSIYS